MEEILQKQSKETRCYIMSAVLFFLGFNQTDEMTGIRAESCLDVLGLTKVDMESFPMPDYSQIVSHLKPIADSEVRNWVITNTYSSVLKSRKVDAMRAFRTFCSDLAWSADEINKSMDFVEVLYELKPVDSGTRGTSLNPSSSASSNSSSNTGSRTSSGCFSVIVLIIISTVLLSFVLI